MAVLFTNGGKLLALKILAEVYTGQKFILFTNDITLTEATVLGDLTEAAYSGYIRQTPVLDTLGMAGSDGEAVMETVTFICDSEIAEVDVHGWGLIGNYPVTEEPTLIFVEKFSPYLVVSHVDDKVEFDVTFKDRQSA